MTESNATKLAIFANVCDAVDPRHDLDARYEALDRATAVDQGVAIAAAVELMHYLLQSHELQFGAESLADIMRQLRVVVGHLFVEGEGA